MTARIVVIGNVNADRVYRLEGPLIPGRGGPGVDLGLRLGGSGANAAGALSLAGNAVSLISHVGDDDAGAQVRRWLSEYAIDTRGVLTRQGATPSCIILVDGSGERTIIGLSRTRPPPVWPDADLSAAAAIYLAHHWPPSDTLCRRIVEAGCPVVCQLRAAGHLPRSTVVAASDHDFAPDDPADRWAALALRGHVADWLVVTQGRHGAWATDGTQRLQIAAAPADSVDATGAGDAFAAGLVHALARGRPMADALALAAAWGARAVAQAGSVLPPDAAPLPDTPPAGTPLAG